MCLRNAIIWTLCLFVWSGPALAAGEEASEQGKDVLPETLSDGSEFAQRYSVPAEFRQLEHKLFREWGELDVGEDMNKAPLGTSELPFSRKAPGGAMLRLERQVQKRDVSGPAKYLGNVELIAKYTLTKHVGAKAWPIWEAVMFLSRGREGVGPRFIFWDAVQVDNRVYVLYQRDHFMTVDVVEERQGPKWVKLTSTVLADGIRPRGLAQFCRDPRSEQIGIAYMPYPSKEERWIGFDRLRELETRGVGSKREGAASRETAAGSSAEVLPPDLGDGSAFSGEVADQKGFSRRLAEVANIGALAMAASTSESVLFARSVPDGSTLRLKAAPRTPAVIVRTNGKPASAWNAPFGLTKDAGAESRPVWATQFLGGEGAASDIRRGFVFWDAAMVRDQIYVLHSESFVPLVEVIAKGPDGKWNKVMSHALTDVSRVDALARLFRDAGTGELGVIYKDSPTNERRWVGLDQVRRAAAH